MTTSITDAHKQAYSNGEKTYQEIATELGVSLSSVAHAMKGVQKPEKHKYTSVKNVDRDREIVRLFTEEKQTLRQLGEKFGVSHQAISLILKKNGVDPSESLAKRHAEKSQATVAQLTEKREAKAKARSESIQKLSDLWKSGASVEDIRQVFGLKSVGAMNVRLVLARKKHGLDMFPLRNHRKEVSTEVPVIE